MELLCGKILLKYFRKKNSKSESQNRYYIIPCPHHVPISQMDPQKHDIPCLGISKYAASQKISVRVQKPSDYGQYGRNAEGFLHRYLLF